MTSPHQSVACPWCTHESTTGDEFRTHLMVEHRKSDLARYVLEVKSERADNAEAGDAGVADGPEEPSSEDDSERELVAR